MKLYYGGCGPYKAFVVAGSGVDATIKIGEKINAPFLPITAEEVSGVDGYIITPVPAVIEPTEDVVQETEAEPAQEDEPEAIYKCKKCDFTCSNKGELLAHYRSEHPKKGA